MEGGKHPSPHPGCRAGTSQPIIAGEGFPTSDHPPGAILMGGGAQWKRGRAKEPRDGGAFPRSSRLMAGGGLECARSSSRAIPESIPTVGGDIRMIYEQYTNSYKIRGCTNLRSCCTKVPEINQHLFNEIDQYCCLIIHCLTF